MNTHEFDLVTIGTGIAAGPARKLAKEGWRVALVDAREPGGTCALRGCSPKKMLRTGAATLDLLRRMEGNGITGSEGVQGNWQDLVRFKDSYTDPIPENNKKIYSKMGIEFFEGKASFQDGESVRVQAAGAEPVLLRARKFHLATGARPATLDFPGGELALSSDDFIHLPELPRRIVFIGGGFISMEFAHLAARYGSECTVIHPRKLPLPAFDPDLVEVLTKVSEEDAGIRFVRDSRVCRITRDGGVYTVLARAEDGREATVEADLVVHGAGRVPNLDGLNLEAANVAYGRNGVAVNEYLQSTTNPDVYSAGDCADTGAPHLSLVASIEGRTVSHNILHCNRQTADYSSVSAVVFTLPALASTGLSEAECERQGLEFEKKFGESKRWFTNRHLNEPAGAYKILLEKGTGRILGAHLLAHHCEEFVNLFALAIRHKLTRRDLNSVLWAHPSAASDLVRMLS